jgi:hypothetical protein
MSQENVELRHDHPYISAVSVVSAANAPTTAKFATSTSPSPR